MGLEAAKRISELSPKSKILCVSENRSRDIAEQAFRTGATGYLVKSDAASDLLSAVKSVLGRERFISSSLLGHFLVATTLNATQTGRLSWIAMLISGIR